MTQSCLPFSLCQPRPVYKRQHLFHCATGTVDLCRQRWVNIQLEDSAAPELALPWGNMPELPEVETVCRGLLRHLRGRTFIRVKLHRSALRLPLPIDFAGRLVGRRVEHIGRRGKYILVNLDDGTVIIAHLGMSGRMMIHNIPYTASSPHDHVVFHFDDDSAVVFNDTRRFGLLTLALTGDLDHHPLLARLGPEPLDNTFCADILANSLAGKRTPIKSALLDQRVVAGLGNIYACESLYRARLSPRRLAESVIGLRVRRLAIALREVLSEAIAVGGSSLKDYLQASGELGYFQHRFAVYGREGRPCPECKCAGGVRRIVQSGRSTFYCPHRQR